MTGWTRQALRLRPFEPAPVAPEPQIGQMAAGRLGAHLAALGNLQPVRELLQVVERLRNQPSLRKTRQARQPGSGLGCSHRNTGRQTVPERGGPQLHRPLPLFMALQDQLVGAAVEDQIEPAVLAPRLARAAERARHAVDQLDRGPLGALGAHRVPAEAVDRQDRLLPARGGHLRDAQLDLRPGQCRRRCRSRRGGRLRESRSRREAEHRQQGHEGWESTDCRPGVEHRVPSMWWGKRFRATVGLVITSPALWGRERRDRGVGVTA